MKKNLYSLSVVAVTMLALSGSALAEGTNLDVNFTANIRETTCDMKLMGGTGSDTDQTLLIGNGGQVRLDDVKAGTANANFKIVIVECPASLTSLKATVKEANRVICLAALLIKNQKPMEAQISLLLKLPEPAHRRPLLSSTLTMMLSDWSGVQQKSRIKKFL